MFSCLCKGSQKRVFNPLQWNECQPFIPPISSGEVIKVYDGDTITVAAQLPYPESPYYRFSVRLKGIDAPEMKGRSEEERAAAHRAQKALEDLILHKQVRLENRSQEKYGRLLADVYFGEIHINQWLLDNGYAKAYDGWTKEVFQPSTSAIKNKLEGVNVE
jgi:endonuclease YncB( thermonuclease family)